MVIVFVEPAGQGCSSFSFGVVVAGVGPAVGHGAVESLDLAVGLGPVGDHAARLADQARAGAGTTRNTSPPCSTEKYRPFGMLLRPSRPWEGCRVPVAADETGSPSAAKMATRQLSVPTSIP